MFGSSCSDARVLRPAPSLEDGGYEISGFQPADAVDIPQAFEAVYGKDYLSSQVYDAAGFAGSSQRRTGAWSRWPRASSCRLTASRGSSAG
jgi:hypothetical protein